MWFVNAAIASNLYIVVVFFRGDDQTVFAQTVISCLAGLGGSNSNDAYFIIGHEPIMTHLMHTHVHFQHIFKILFSLNLIGLVFFGSSHDPRAKLLPNIRF